MFTVTHLVSSGMFLPITRDTSNSIRNTRRILSYLRFEHSTASPNTGPGREPFTLAYPSNRMSLVIILG